jgi:hypothetical protein
MKKLLVSFSGGETSAFMLWWILKNWSDRFQIEVVFANTGEENEETLVFVQKCSEHFNVQVTWVEAVVHSEYRKATTHKIVDFETAHRGGRLFEDMVKKYGISNKMYPHCNRELKLRPIQSYLRSLGWTDYYTAIGIRNDEADRINADYKDLKLLYPLVTNKPFTKKHVNFWWSQQPFRLELKGYEGNCKTCWKKSDLKLWTIAKESPEKFDTFRTLEEKYGDFIPESREHDGGLVRFFRGNRSAEDIIKEAQKKTQKALDDSRDNNFQTSLLDYEESCDIYSLCGDQSYMK